jgi:predicted HTH domain antitoxin
VELPADLVREAGLSGGDASKGAAKLLALELFRQERVSLGRAAELCETPLEEFMDFVTAHGVPTFTYTLEDYEEDRRTIAKLGL